MRTRASLLAALAMASAAAPASAQDEPSFALEPVAASSEGYYVFDAAPGQVIEGKVLVVNAGTAAGTARLDAVDATTGATTGAVYETVGDPSEDIGAWVRLERDRVELAPGESVEVGFTVTVPDDARRGEHLGGLVAATAGAAEGSDAGGDDRSFEVNVVNQSILAVQVDLPGEARQLLAVRDVQAGGSPGYQTLRLALSNPGERMVRGEGRVVVEDADGAVVSRQTFPIDTFLPRTRIDFPLVLREKALVPGDYRATVELDWGAGRERQELPFTVTRKNIEQAFGSEGVAQLPGSEEGGGGSSLPLIVGGVVALLLLGGLGTVLFRRHTRRLEERILRQAAAARDDEPRFSVEEPAPERARDPR